MSSHRIDTSFPELSSFFASSYGNLKVPDYQRNFDWNMSHVEDLWEDIHSYIKKYEEGIDEQFYVGTIILKSPEENFQVGEDKRYEIVDGQQRLTSFYLLAIALRQKFKDFGDEETAKNIDRAFINSYKKKNYVPKLLGNKKIRRVLRYISNENWDGTWPKKDKGNPNCPWSDMHGNTLNSVVNKLKNSLQSHLDEMEGNGRDPKPFDAEKLEVLNDVYENIKITILGVHSDERAFYLFETTNARGKDLEPGDLLKNHLFKEATDSERDKIYSRWDDVVENSQNKLIIMLKHFYYVHDSHVQKKDLYKKLRNLMDDSEELLTQIEDYSRFHRLMHKGTFEEFKTYLSSDLKIYNASKTNKEYIRLFLSIRALRFFKSELTYPVIYSFLTKFSELLSKDKILNSKDGRKKRSDFKKILPETLKAFENFQFINYKICSDKGNKIEKPYARFASELYKCKDVVEFLEKLEGTGDSENQGLYEFLRSTVLGPKTFEENFLEISYSGKKSDSDLIHYIFHKIEETRNKKVLKGDNAIFQGVDRTYDIEHFASSEHTTHSNTQEEFEEYKHIHKEIKLNQDYDNLINMIGNLVSMDTDLNNDLSNMIPRKKLEFINKYFHSTNYITHSFLKDFNVSKIIESEETHEDAPGPKLIVGDIYRDEILEEKNKRIQKEGFEPAKFQSQVWNSKCIVQRSKDLAKECYESVFKIGDDVNFPMISKQRFSKYTQ